MSEVISDEIIEKINYFGGKFSIIRDVAKLALTCSETGIVKNTGMTSLLNILSTSIAHLYDEYSEFNRQVEYPDDLKI